MSFKIIGAHNSWLIKTEEDREMCFFAEENNSQEALKQALHYVNKINNSNHQLERTNSSHQLERMSKLIKGKKNDKRNSRRSKH